MRISIVGAYGYTGKIICEELNKIKCTYSIYGKNINTLNDLKRGNSNVINTNLISLRVYSDSGATNLVQQISTSSMNFNDNINVFNKKRGKYLINLNNYCIIIYRICSVLLYK